MNQYTGVLERKRQNHPRWDIADRPATQLFVLVESDYSIVDGPIEMEANTARGYNQTRELAADSARWEPWDESVHGTIEEVRWLVFCDQQDDGNYSGV